jgi:hypothetical protein
VMGGIDIEMLLDDEDLVANRNLCDFVETVLLAAGESALHS